MYQLLSSQQISKKVTRLGTDWNQTKQKNLSRSFEFENYAAAGRFVNCLAEIATAIDHHPSITWQHKMVTVEIYTHEVNGLTDMDFKFALRVKKCLG